MNQTQTWEHNLRTFLNAIEAIGGEAEGCSLKPPVRLSEVKKVEEHLGIPLPESLVKVATGFCGGMELSWSLPDDEELELPLPVELKGIFAGDFIWSIKDIIAAEEERRGWEQQVFSDLDDEYDRVWHNKLGFMAVGNGDFVAFDLSVPADPPIVYLSHDGGNGHGYILGHNFTDFMDKWSKIGCVGCEDWQLIPFMDSPVSGIMPDSDNAKLWRSWLKVEL